jgi:hypothetical protein
MAILNNIITHNDQGLIVVIFGPFLEPTTSPQIVETIGTTNETYLLYCDLCITIMCIDQ